MDSGVPWTAHNVIPDERRQKMLPVILLIATLLVGCSHQYHALRNSPPENMVFIPAGWFEMGSDGTEGRLGMAIGVDEIPRHRAYVKDFYIDRYEVTNARFYEFLIKTNNVYRPAHWSERGTFEKGEHDHPVVDVDWIDSDAYCTWVGKRLPLEVEWEKAARGTDGRLWTWGDEYAKGAANPLESGRNWTAPVGSYPEDVSPYGVYDMAGNVREWTAGWYQAYPGNTLPPGFYKGSYRAVRGGSYTTPLYRYARTSSRYAIESTLATRGLDWHTTYDQGFRCAMSP